MARNLARRGFALDVSALRAAGGASASPGRSRSTGCAPSATPTPRRSAWPRARARMSHRSSPAARASRQGLAQAERELDARAGGARAVAARSAEPAARHRSPRVATRARTSKCAAGASRAASRSSRAITSRSGERLHGLDFEAAARISGARFVVHARSARAAAPGARAVHARSAHARARLHRGLRALPRAAAGADGHRPAAEVRAGPVRGARRAGLLSHPDRGGAGDEPRARADHRRPSHCR